MSRPTIILAVCFILACLGAAFEYSRNAILQTSIDGLRQAKEETDFEGHKDALSRIKEQTQTMGLLSGLTNRVAQLQAELEQTKAKLNLTQSQFDDTWIELQRWKAAWKKLPGE